MPKLNSSFTTVPHSVARSPHISPGAKALYTCVLSYAWGSDRAWPSQARLAANMGSSPTSIRTWLSELRQHGLIQVKKRGAKNSPNIYIIQPVAESAETPSKSDYRWSGSDGQSLTTKKKQVLKQNSKKQTQGDPIVASLTASGVTKSVAAKLVLEHGSDQCHRQLGWIAHRKSRSQPAVLVQAIRGNWPAPAAFEKAKPRTSVGVTASVSLGAIMQQLAKNGAPGSEFMERLGQQAGLNFSSRAQSMQN